MKQFDFNNKNILIVEDTITSTRFFDAALSRTNASLFWAEDADEAIKIFDESNIDMVLLDINLLTTSGFDVLKYIRKKDKSIPVVVQTAYILSDEEEMSFKLGANDFIAKPIKLSQLMETVEKFLGKEEAHSTE